MTNAYSEFYSFYFTYVRSEHRARMRLVAENKWLYEHILAKFPGFTGSDRDLKALAEILPALSAVRFINQHDERSTESDLLDIAAERPDFDYFVRFMQMGGIDADSVRGLMESCELVNASGQLVSKNDDNDVKWCEYHETYEIGMRYQKVYVSIHTAERWCDDAYDKNAFWCDISEESYSNLNFTCGQTVSGADICVEVANDNGYYRCDNGDYSDDPDDYEDDRIPAYHDASRNWSYGLSNGSTRSYFGFEIEMDFPSSSRRYECWDALFSGSCYDFCAERDGSLSDETGMEVISRPFSLHELRAEDSKFRKMIAKLKKYHAREGDDEYGVHVTTNIGRLTEDHKERFRRFLCVNRSLSEVVARRKSNEYCNYEWGWGDKHSAVAQRDDMKSAAEVRIFKSSVNYDVLMSYAEYVEAVIDWTLDPNHLIEGPLASSLFRHWVCLGGQYPALTARFPRQTAKEINPCVLPSSSRPIEHYRKKSSSSASRTTPTAADSPTSTTTTADSVAWWYDAASSHSRTFLRPTDNMTSTIVFR